MITYGATEAQRARRIFFEEEESSVLSVSLWLRDFRQFLVFSAAASAMREPLRMFLIA